MKYFPVFVVALGHQLSPASEDERIKLELQLKLWKILENT